MTSGMAADRPVSRPERERLAEAMVWTAVGSGPAGKDRRRSGALPSCASCRWLSFGDRPGVIVEDAMTVWADPRALPPQLLREAGG